MLPRPRDSAAIRVLEAEQGVSRRQLRVQPGGLLQFGQGCITLVEGKIQPPQREPKLRIARVAPDHPLNALRLTDVGELTLIERRILGRRDFEMRQRKVELA